MSASSQKCSKIPFGNPLDGTYLLNIDGSFILAHGSTSIWGLIRNEASKMIIKYMYVKINSRYALTVEQTRDNSSLCFFLHVVNSNKSSHQNT